MILLDCSAVPAINQTPTARRPQHCRGAACQSGSVRSSSASWLKIAGLAD